MKSIFPNNSLEHDQKEKSFLEAAGFDLGKGWYEEDYQSLRKEYPDEHQLEFGYY